MKELYVKKGDNEYEKVEFKDLLSLQFDYDGDGVLLITKENYLRLKMAVDLNDRVSIPLLVLLDILIFLLPTTDKCVEFSLSIRLQTSLITPISFTRCPPFR